MTRCVYFDRVLAAVEFADALPLDQWEGGAEVLGAVGRLLTREVVVAVELPGVPFALRDEALRVVTRYGAAALEAEGDGPVVRELSLRLRAMVEALRGVFDRIERESGRTGPGSPGACMDVLYRRGEARRRRLAETDAEREARDHERR